MPAGRSAKDRLKRGIKRMVRLLAPPRALRPPTSRILTYHSIGHRTHEMNVRPEDFEAQMTWLARTQSIIPLEEAAEGKPGVAITFDDGYLDNLTHAAPILRRLELPATVFMVIGRLGEALQGDPDPATGVLMNLAELRQLAGQGVQIGGHTVSHPRLSALSDTEQRREILGCKAALEDALGVPVTAFAYPYGARTDYTPDTVRLVRDAGFRLAVSNRYGHNTPVLNRFALRRIWIDATDDLATFQAKVDGRLDALAWLDSRTGIRLRHLLNRRLGTA
jgi:peptidoglycan/xylan/chitin deacetylase (PgdA/CDA1 family)